MEIDDGGTRSVTAAGALVTRGFDKTPPAMLVLGGVVSLQVGVVVAKQLFPVIGPGGVVTLRLVFAAVVLGALWRPGLRWERGTLGLIVVLGTVLAAHHLSFYSAIERLPLGVAVTVEFCGPLAVALLGSRRPLDAAWAVLAGAGVVMTALTGSSGTVLASGLLFACAAAVFWAAYIWVAAVLGRRISDGRGLALGTTWAAVVILPVGIVDGGAALLHWNVLLIGLGVALLSNVLSYSLQTEALRRMPPRMFSVLVSLEPAVAALIGLVALGEAVRPVQATGICAVVAASIGATRTPRS